MVETKMRHRPQVHDAFVYLTHHRFSPAASQFILWSLPCCAAGPTFWGALLFPLSIGRQWTQKGYKSALSVRARKLCLGSSGRFLSHHISKASEPDALLLFYLKGRDTEFSHLQVDSLSTAVKAGPGQKQESGPQPESPLGWQSPNYWNHFLFPWGVHQQLPAWEAKERILKSSILLWDVGVLNNDVTAAPNAHLSPSNSSQSLKGALKKEISNGSSSLSGCSSIILTLFHLQ